MTNLDATQIGTVGEFFVASVLGGYGYEVIHSPAKGFDLLVLPADERSDPIRIDVKTKSASSGQRTYSIRRGKTTTFREYQAGACDLFALVCLEDMAIAFVPCKNYDKKSTIYINPEKHRAIDPYKSWLQAINGELDLDLVEKKSFMPQLALAV
jgi:hypothetical protein